MNRFLQGVYVWSLLLVSGVAFAQGTGTGGGGDETGTGGDGAGGTAVLENPLRASSITQFFLDLLQIILIFAVPIIVFFIIYAGFLYVTARGNQEQVTKASRALGYAILGGVIILGAQVILTVIEGTVAAVQG